jgi:hypothetical protein
MPACQENMNIKRQGSIRSLVFLIGLTFLNGSARSADYLTDVKPLFKENCYRCHAGSQPKSGFRLDTGSFARQGGDRGSLIIPGDGAASPFIHVLLGTHGQVSQMPYRDAPLSSKSIHTIVEWIDEGALSPADEIPEEHIHWAFKKPLSPEIPENTTRFQTANPIDHFVFNRLVAAKLTPSKRANQETLIRRLYLDVTGTPPTIEAIDDYLDDYAINATEKLIDELLTSPRFGERWGRHWLDMARYADSNGYSVDSPRSMWRYRDYVVDAINQNRPFDQFATEQLAGDLLPNPTTEQLIATGFHRNTQINQEGGIDKEQFRIESIVDRVATTGTAFLGLTIACAQCHNHKFDPIAQSEYYQVFAFFNNQDEPNIETPRLGELHARRKHATALKLLESAIEESESDIQQRIFDWEKFLSEEDLKDLSPSYRLILTKPRELRTAEESQQLYDHFSEENNAHQQLKKQLRALSRKRPRVTTSMVLRERKEKRLTHVHIKGDFTRLGPEVVPGTPRVLNPFPKKETANRLDFANWLSTEDNPLFARVTVNRIWQQYFGRGIVETENDFGTQGIPPSHPDLLDWLATELIRNGWNIKAIHKKILMSATYQQSSKVTATQKELDPDNRLVGRQTRMRLESEIVRDVALAASGLLSTRMGGPSVHPPQPSGVMTLGQVQRSWKPDEGENRYRRGLYTFFWRATPHPSLTVFDSPDAFSTCSRRIRSNTPLQALTLLNDPAFFEIASALSTRIAKLECDSDQSRIRESFRICLGRYPSRKETQQLLLSLDQAVALNPNESEPLVKWTFLSRILLNLDETITRE